MNKKSFSYNSLPQEASFSERLNFAMNQMGITQAELARRIGVKQQAIQYLCSNRAKGSRSTPKIAAILNVNSQWLADGEGTIQLNEDPRNGLDYAHKKIPILQPDQIKSLIKNQAKIQLNKNLTNFSDLKSTQWIFTDTSFGPNSYALKLKDQAMSPRFEEGTIVIVDPDKIPQNGNFIIAYIYKTNELLFRQLAQQQTKKILYPLNTCGYNEIIMSNLDVIYGVLGEIRWVNI